jgi:hypothetical protein
MRELVRLRGVTDAFLAEGAIGYVVGLLDVRGADDSSYASFCREALDDDRAATSVLGLEATTSLAELGHPSVRADAAALVAAADPSLLAELPSWCAHVGRVHVVEAGSLRTADGSETVLHVLLDYDADPAAGSRHLLSIAVQHVEDRVHLLDVRARAPRDSIAPIAEQYAGSADVLWSWHEAGELEALVGDAVRATWTHSPNRWPVRDVEGGVTPAWAFGVRRLEQVTGTDLRPSR